MVSFFVLGRVARAGSSGTAYSFISFDELPYVLDLHLFLGKSMKLAKINLPKGSYDFSYIFL